MSRREGLAWAAGLADGEGSFMLATAPSPFARFSLEMCDEPSVRQFGDITGLRVTGPYTHKNRLRLRWRAQCSGTPKTEKLWLLLRPWLSDLKNLQAQRAIAAAWVQA